MEEEVGLLGTHIPWAPKVISNFRDRAWGTLMEPGRRKQLSQPITQPGPEGKAGECPRGEQKKPVWGAKRKW